MKKDFNVNAGWWACVNNLRKRQSHAEYDGKCASQQSTATSILLISTAISVPIRNGVLQPWRTRFNTSRMVPYKWFIESTIIRNERKRTRKILIRSSWGSHLREAWEKLAPDRCDGAIGSCSEAWTGTTWAANKNNYSSLAVKLLSSYSFNQCRMERRTCLGIPTRLLDVGSCSVIADSLSLRM